MTDRPQRPAPVPPLAEKVARHLASRMAIRRGDRYDAVAGPDDIYVVALEAAMRALSEAGLPDNPFTYVYGVARRSVIDYLRSVLGNRRSLKAAAAAEGRARHASLSDIYEQHYPTTKADGEDRAELALLAVRMARLPEREREALLAGVEGTTLDRLSARFGITEARVCQIRQKARRRLAA